MTMVREQNLECRCSKRHFCCELSCIQTTIRINDALYSYREAGTAHCLIEDKKTSVGSGAEGRKAKTIVAEYWELM